MIYLWLLAAGAFVAGVLLYIATAMDVKTTDMRFMTGRYRHQMQLSFVLIGASALLCLVAMLWLAVEVVV